jgi:hypothetical protein
MSDPRTQALALARPIDERRPWDDPSLDPIQPTLKPTPPGTPVGAAPYDPKPYTYQIPDPVGLAEQLKALREVWKSFIPERLWNTPRPNPTPTPLPPGNQ